MNVIDYLKQRIQEASKQMSETDIENVTESFDQIVAAIQILRDAGVPIQVGGYSALETCKQMLKQDLAEAIQLGQVDNPFQSNSQAVNVIVLDLELGPAGE